MAQSGQRKCLCCEEFFDLDPRNRKRQRYCSKPECRRASKLASQAAWLAQAHNVDYFRDPVHVARVQAWRAAHPGYGAGKSQALATLQDDLPEQVHDLIEESALRGEIAAGAGPTALQDSLSTLSPLMAGLIAHLFELTLQDDMALTTQRLVQLGLDVMNRSHDENSQTSATPRAVATGARAVQLG